MTFWQDEPDTHPVPVTRSPEPFLFHRVWMPPIQPIQNPKSKFGNWRPGSRAPGQLGRLLLHLLSIVWIDDEFCLVKIGPIWQIYHCGREFWAWRGYGLTGYRTRQAANSWIHTCRLVIKTDMWGGLAIPDDLKLRREVKR